jgi:hypothetical protein
MEVGMVIVSWGQEVSYIRESYQQIRGFDVDAVLGSGAV